MKNSEIAKKFVDGYEKGKGSNVFIDGDTIYSYGHHFPMAKRWNKDGIDYLYNPKGYSNSTSRHQSYVRCELHNYTVLEVKQCDIKNSKKQKENNLNSINEHNKKLARARVPHSKEYHENMIKHYEEQNKLLDKYITQTE